MIAFPDIELAPGYRARVMEPEAFHAAWATHHATMFGTRLRGDPEALSSPERLEATKVLRASYPKTLILRVGVFHGEELVGWHLGNQTAADEFYMRSSAILPAHRRRGLYRALLRAVVEAVAAAGFQKITSNHHVTNNAVLIPKLQMGFVITGVSLDAVFGTLATLTYLTNPRHRALLAYRAGAEVPDAEMREWLGLAESGSRS